MDLSALGLWTGTLHHKSSMNVRDNTSTSDGSLDESVELLITSDSKLQVSWGDSLNLKIFGSVTCELKDLCGQVLEDGSTVDCGCGSDSAAGTDSALQESVDSSDWELNYSKIIY